MDVDAALRMEVERKATESLRLMLVGFWSIRARSRDCWKSGQSALAVCHRDLGGMGVGEVKGRVSMMGRWSEPRSGPVFHSTRSERWDEAKEMSGEDREPVAGFRRVGESGSFRMDREEESAHSWIWVPKGSDWDRVSQSGW